MKMFNISRLQIIHSLGKRCNSVYSVEKVLSEENLKRAAAKFANMKPIRLQTHAPYKRAAVLIPLCVVDKKVSLLYTLRAPHLKTHRGQVSFPGGMMDSKDRTLEDTALRETREELGLDEKKVRIWGRGQLIVTRGDMSVLPVIGEIKKELCLDSLKVNQGEVEQVFTVTLEELCNPKRMGYTQFREGFSTPVFMVGPKKIWGLTALITNAFLKSLLPSSAYSHRIKYVPLVTVGGNRYFGHL
ncbi:hypothetical protein ILUMI_08215 [Ignelater luminosus]|uniref:Nudix hydrolase domain-containing protein n=1 Tax=Ignelater luminosus TaxID=2038154 RepID=A0A8K0D7A6_IGNLU|nr:hypothetical protein ILUMI_08215 [Ignelater luminosus]